MSVNWKKGFDPPVLLNEIEKNKTYDKNNKVNFSQIKLSRFDSVLLSMLEFPADIPLIDAQDIVFTAIKNTGTKGPITQKDMLSEVRKIVRAYQNNDSERYVLVSSISIDKGALINRVHIGNSLIIFERSIPRKFLLQAKDLKDYAEKSLYSKSPNNYLGVRVHVSAKSIHQAAENALDSLDLVRGIWNWTFNLSRQWRHSFGGKQKPVNAFILGPIHTLHKTNGKLATGESWWYETSYLEKVSPLRPKENELTIINEIPTKVIKKLNNIKYSLHIKEGFIRYSRALDDRNWETAFLKLWSVLELLTNTGYSNYDVTIERTCFLFSNNCYHKQLLRHLRENRNSTVHNDKSNVSMESDLYYLKSYIEELLRFHLYNKYGFNTFAEACDFLDNSTDEVKINTRINDLLNVKKFRGYT